MAKHIAKHCKAKATVDLSKAISKEDTNAKATACKMITSIAKDIMGKETQKIKCAFQENILRGRKPKPRRRPKMAPGGPDDAAPPPSAV